MGIYDNTELATMLDAKAYQYLQEKMVNHEEIGIALDGIWRGREWKKRLPDTYYDEIKVAPMPKQNGGGYASMSGGWTLAISKQSKNQEEAFNFIKIAANKDNLLEYVILCANMATRKDIMEEERYAEINSYMPEMSKYTEFTKFRPGVEAYPSVSIEIQSAVESVITGKSSAEESMETYASNVKAILGKDEYIDK